MCSKKGDLCVSSIRFDPFCLHWSCSLLNVNAEAWPVGGNNFNECKTDKTWFICEPYVNAYVGCFRFTEWLGYIFERNRHTFDWWCVTKPAVCWRQVFSQCRVVWCWCWANCYRGAGTYEWAGSNSYCFTTPLCLTSLTRPPYWYPEPPGKQRRDVWEILWESLDLGDCMPLRKRM
mgnify:CR=1 FL=1